MSVILVTGAAGFIGSHTVELLLREGHVVVGVDNFRTGHAANLHAAQANPRFHFSPLDAGDAGPLRELLQRHRVDAVLHLAALASVAESIAQPEATRGLNFEATQRVFAAAAGAGCVQRLVFASSAAVYGAGSPRPLSEADDCRPLNPYGAAKRQAEEWLLAEARGPAGIGVWCLRYFNVLGPRQDARPQFSGVATCFAQALQAGRPPVIHGDGEQTRDFVAVGDVARANLRAILSPAATGGIANICTGRTTSLNELYFTMGRIRGHAPAPQYGPARAHDILHSRGDPARAQRELGFTASTPLEDTLASLLGSR